MQAMPQASNPNMAAFMQGQSGMPSQGMQPPPLGKPPQPTPMGPTDGQPPQGMGSPQQPQGQLDPKIQQLIQMLMKQGRGGDTLMAHLTPGEMEVPPEVQTPKVLATLKKAYQDKGVDPAQFTAGSPSSSVNPSTGLPEYNFMSAFLPAALGLAGAAAAPFTGGASLGLTPLMLSSLGGAAGTTIGGLIAGQKPTQALLSGALSGAGGYGLGSLAGEGTTVAADAANQALTPAQQAVMSASDPTAAMAAAQKMGMSTASPAIAQTAGSMGPPAPGLTNLWGNLPAGSVKPFSSVGSTIGGYVGNQLGAPPKPNSPNYPPGFNTPMTPFNELPSYQVGLGQNQFKGPNASFSNFNPATNYPAAYNHFPVM